MRTSNPIALITACALGLAACQPPVDDDGEDTAKLGTLAKLAIGVAAGYVVGKMIYDAGERAAERDAYYAQANASYSRVTSSYDYSNSSGGEVPSPATQSDQIHVSPNNAAMKRVTDASQASIRTAASSLFSGATHAYACEALCGGYYNGSNYGLLNYSDTYYGSALELGDVLATGSTAAEAFAHLRAACPSGAALIDPSSYTQQTAYKRPLRTATAASVCIPTPATGVRCSATCNATSAKAGTTQTIPLSVKAGDALVGYLGVLYNEDCVGKFMSESDYSFDIANDGGSAISLMNACVSDPTAAPSNNSYSAGPPSDDGRVAAFNKTAAASCSEALCPQIAAASDDQNCVQAVRKTDGSLALQFSEEACPQNPAEIVLSSKITLELAMTEQTDPQIAALAAANPTGFKQLGLTSIPHSGTIRARTTGGWMDVGAWIESPMGGDDYVTVSALCTTKVANEPPGVGAAQAFNCTNDLSNGHFMRIGPQWSSTAPASQ
jgi:hypothetical protein